MTTLVPANVPHITVFFELHAPGTFVGRAEPVGQPFFHERHGRAQSYRVVLTIQLNDVMEWLPLFDAADIVASIECSIGEFSDLITVLECKAADDARTATVVINALVTINSSVTRR